MIDDMRKDVQAQKEMLCGAEDRRYELQVSFVQTSTRVKEDSQMHTEYQQRLIQDNERLRAELNESRQLLARTQ